MLKQWKFLIGVAGSMKNETVPATIVIAILLLFVWKRKETLSSRVTKNISLVSDFCRDNGDYSVQAKVCAASNKTLVSHWEDLAVFSSEEIRGCEPTLQSRWWWRVMAFALFGDYKKPCSRNTASDDRVIGIGQEGAEPLATREKVRIISFWAREVSARRGCSLD